MNNYEFGRMANPPGNGGHHDCIADGDSEWFFAEAWDIWTSSVSIADETYMEWGARRWFR